MRGNNMDLTKAVIGNQYEIEGVLSGDEELENFLFSLGCYAGERITIISMISGNYVVSIKDARYSIDSELAKAIQVVA